MKPSTQQRIREHALLSAAFVASRVLLAWAGLRMNFELNWMFLADPADLRTRLLETSFYFHAYPPGMGLLTGLLLKVGGSHANLLAELLFSAFGLVLANSLYYALRACAVPARAALAVAACFAVTPAALYLEHLWLWEQLVATALALAGALLYRAVRRPSFRGWLGFFLVCAGLGWFRATFQLTWFGAMVALATWLAPAPWRRRVLIAASGPLLLLLALSSKNWWLFGTFGTASAGGGNLTHVTIRRLPPEVRDAWVREGKLSPFALHHVYAGPEEFLPYFGRDEAKNWPNVSTLQSLERPTFHSANFNHWVFLAVNRRRAEDAFTYLRARPGEYARTVLEGTRQFFQPTTTWHPLDRSDASPHHQHRVVLGPYERAYNHVVHDFPFAPVGCYVILPLIVLWTVKRIHAEWRTRIRYRRARLALLTFSLFQVAYVGATSALFTIGESARYRYQIEAQIWLLGALAAVAWLRDWRRNRSSRAPSLRG